MNLDNHYVIPTYTPNTSQLWTSTDWAVNRYKAALEDIVELLGPVPSCEANECEGCAYEMAEALRLALVALGRAATNPYRPEHGRTDVSDE